MGPAGKIDAPRTIAALLFAVSTLLAVTARAAAPEPVASGQAAYLRRCAGCHGREGLGDGPDAPIFGAKPADLRADSLLRSYSDPELTARLLEGRQLRLEVRPDALRTHAVDTEALYQYLRRLPATRWETVDAGEGVYFERCVDCHGRYGHPPASLPPGVRRPRDLSHPEFQSSVTDAELAVLARHGKDHMPALIPRLRKEEASQVSSFLRSLSAGREIYDRYCMSCHGAHGVPQAEPFAETVTAVPTFDAGYFSRTDPEETRRAIWHMLQDARPVMPHFREILTPDELRDILVYLRSLPSGRAVPTEQPSIAK